MFKIYDGREHFYQWDLDRKLIVGDRTIQAVHFCNRTGACAITRDCYDVNGMWLVDVPNLCLQESYRLKVYGFSAAKYTTVSSQFDVKSRTKPDGYVYTDDEVNCWQDLDQRVAALEENPVSDMVLFNAIDNYFDTNPIVGKAGTGESAENFNDYVNNNAYGKYSHTEGFNTQTLGEYAHAEGKDTNAAGDCSHAEGLGTGAVGNYSHAEGFGTTAWGNSQHVQGRLNIRDEEKKYAHIVGNGDWVNDVYVRSNAHTLDWDGNAWFAGNVRVGGTCWDDATELGGAPDLTGYATEEYVNNAISNIEVDGGGIEYVNATGDEIIELDKTYEEIMAMIEAGKVVVINYDGNLYHQFNDSPVFRYVGAMENRQISFNKRDYSVRYSENIVPAYEDVGTIVEEMLEDRDYQTAEQVNAAIANYVGVIENGTY